jgi:hypothetical protein
MRSLIEKRAILQVTDNNIGHHEKQAQRQASPFHRHGAQRIMRAPHSGHAQTSLITVTCKYMFQSHLLSFQGGCFWDKLRANLPLYQDAATLRALQERSSQVLTYTTICSAAYQTPPQHQSYQTSIRWALDLLAMPSVEQLLAVLKNAKDRPA